MEKIFKGFLILNWKNGKFNVKVRRPKNLTPFQIPISLEITVNVPEVKELIAKGKIEVSEQKVKQMVIEEI